MTHGERGTDGDQREPAARASEARLRAVFSAMSEGLVIHDRDGRITESNAAAEIILGLTRDQLWGKSSTDPGWQAIHEDGSPFPGDQHPAMLTLRTGMPLRDQVMGIDDPKRGRRWISINSSPIWGERKDRPEFVVATFVDITERKLADAKFSEFSASLQDLYDKAPCGYHSLDAYGKYLYINETELSWLGRSREELIGKMSPRDFLTREGQARFDREFGFVLIDGAARDLEYDLVGIDRAPRRVSISATVAKDKDGRFLMTRGVMHDVTELHQSREQLRRLAVQQQSMLDNQVVGIVKVKCRQIIWRNRALTRIFGYEADELLGRSKRLLYAHEADFERVGVTAYPEIDRGGHYRMPIEMVRKDGSSVWIDLSGVQLVVEPEVSIWFLIDIESTK
jgi:PAS domain S-box-containing protein